MKTLNLALISVILTTCNVMADPEKAYQAGKAFSQSITGQKTKVDDRDIQQRALDAAREAGAKAGGGGKPAAAPKEQPKK